MTLIRFFGLVLDQTNAPAVNTALLVKEVGTGALVATYASETSTTPTVPTGNEQTDAAGAFSFWVDSTKAIYLTVDPSHPGHSVTFGDSTGGGGGSIVVPGTLNQLLLSDGAGGLKAVPLGLTGTVLGTDGVQVLWTTGGGGGGSGIHTYTTLPSSGTEGDIAYNSTDGKLYRYHAGVWTAAVQTNDLIGQIVAAQVADGAINVAKFAAGLTTVELFSALPTTGNFEGRQGYLTTNGHLYRYHSGNWTDEVPVTQLVGQIAASQVADGAINTAKIAAGLGFVQIVDTLPVSGTEGDVALLKTDGILYRWHSGAWTAAVPTTALTGQVTGSQIAAGAINTAKIAAGLSMVELVSSLPATGNFEGRLVYLSTDGQVYRYHGAAWTSTVPAAQISGTLAAAQIASLAASQITGQLTDTQLAAIAAAKVTGQLTDAQVAGLSASKLTGTLTDAQLTAISAAKITGQITSTQITDNAITTSKLAAGAVTAATIAADTITAAQIAANAITATELAAGSVTTSKLVAGAVTANEIAADTITAANIAAGAITASELAAGSVQTSHLTAGAVTASNIAADTITAANIAANAITSSELAANAVTAGKVQAGAISTAELAAGAITTSKLAITTQPTTSVWYDANFADTSAWTICNWGTFPTQQTISDGKSGSTAMHGMWSSAYGTRRAPITVGKRYRMSCWARRTADNTGILYLRWNAGTVESSAYGEVIGLEGAVVTTGWAYYSTDWVATSPFASPMVLLGHTSTAGWSEVQDIRIEELIDGQLMVDGTITAAKIGAGQITSTQIAADTITAANIAANAITSSELAANSVVAGKIQAGAISATELAAGAVTTSKLAAGAVTANEIAANTITAANIAADTITSANIAANAITASELAANAVVAGKIQAGAISATELAAGAVTTSKLAAGAVTANEIAANTITAGKIAAGTITANELGAGSVTTNKLVAGAVTAAQMSVSSLSSMTATIGTLRTAASGGRVEISDNVIKIYDASNVLRVKIGDLSL